MTTASLTRLLSPFMQVCVSGRKVLTLHPPSATPYLYPQPLVGESAAWPCSTRLLCMACIKTSWCPMCLAESPVNGSEGEPCSLPAGLNTLRIPYPIQASACCACHLHDVPACLPACIWPCCIEQMPCPCMQGMPRITHVWSLLHGMIGAAVSTGRHIWACMQAC